jgi:outer membrane protein OmpA-like peptidoglycan-associated protein
MRQDNLKLSKARTELVKKYFIIHGILSSRIKANGMASDNPIGTNATKEGRKKTGGLRSKLKN